MVSVVDEMYYYLRDSDNHPRITICVIRDSVNRCHRGVAICSHEDTPNKKTGRKLALSRALSAMLSKESDDHVSPDGKIMCRPLLDWYGDDITYVIYKSSYDVELTSYEAKKLNRDIRPGVSVTIRGRIYGNDFNVIGIVPRGRRTKVKCLRLEKRYGEGEWMLSWKGHREIKRVSLSNVSSI